MITHGRALEDVKIQKSLGGLPYTNNLSITGEIQDLETYFQVVSPDPLVAALPHGQLQAAEFVSVASTDANDNITGTGARVIALTGVDENYDIYQEIILMNGQTPVQTVARMIPFEMIILQFGSNTNSLGDSVAHGTIRCGRGTFTAGVPDIPLTSIIPDDADPNSRDALFVVPDGNVLMFKALFVTAEPDKKENINAVIQITVKLFNSTTNTWYKTLKYNFDNTFNWKPENIAPFPPRSLIQFRAKSTLEKKTKGVTIQGDFELKELR